MNNEKNIIQATVLSPLSIGEGNEAVWKKGVDYVVKDGKVYHIDLTRAMSAGIDPELLSQYLLNVDENGLLNLLGNRLSLVADRVMKSPVDAPADIRLFIREGLSGRPFIPGSSLKGAIRSVLFKEWKADDENDERSVFGNMSDGSDFMRFIQVADIPMGKTELVNTKIFNLHGDGNDWEGGWKHERFRTNSRFNPKGFNTLYECLMPGECGKGSISIKQGLFEANGFSVPGFEKKKELFDTSEGYSALENLFYIINKHTFDYIGKEIKFFKEYPAEHTEKIIAKLGQLQNGVNGCIEEGSSCILKMSVGSGFHSVTGDWQYDDYTDTGFDTHTGKKRYKSRKVAIYGDKDSTRYALMGFVKLSIN